MDNFRSLFSPEIVSAFKKYSHYFSELRKRIIFTFWAFLISSIIGFIFYEQIIKFLIDLLSLEGVNIVFTSPFQFINLAFSCGFTTGLIAVFPIIIIQALRFLQPALKRKEFKTVTKFLPFCIILFLIGFIFGAIIMKWQIEIFLERSISLGIGNILDVSGLLSTVFLTSALMGIGFQFPIILLLLMRLELLDRKALAKKRMWVYLFSFLFAILLPPDSILADIILSLPLIVLFEITLLINFILEKRKRKHP